MWIWMAKKTYRQKEYSLIEEKLYKLKFGLQRCARTPIWNFHSMINSPTYTRPAVIWKNFLIMSTFDVSRQLNTSENYNGLMMQKIMYNPSIHFILRKERTNFHTGQLWCWGNSRIQHNIWARQSTVFSTFFDKCPKP